jgi:hypothetical protein
MAKKFFKSPPYKSGKRVQLKNTKPSIGYDSQKPVFSLQYMPYGRSCCISRCQKNKKSRILDKILRLSQLTWAEIKKLGKESGFETIPRDRFKVTFPPAVTPEVKILVARYDGDGGRFAGFKINDIFHVVFVGKGLYPH